MNAPRMPRQRPPVFSIAHSFALRLLGIGIAGLVLALLSALTGCGGGDEPEDEHRDTQPVDCRTYPERCK
jgi:hypothetical protein